MAGRAGRRGLDTVGTVVLACWDEVPEEVEIKRMLTGECLFRALFGCLLLLCGWVCVRQRGLDTGGTLAIA